LRAQVQHYGGLRQVSIEQIVSSVGRYHDFDWEFLPRRTMVRDRWEGIEQQRRSRLARSTRARLRAA
jgi:hypothetical protein